MDKESRYLKEYIEYLRDIKKFSLNTIKAYRQDIEQFYNYLKENKLKIGRDVIKDFISIIFLRTRNKATVSRKIYAIRSFFSFLMKKGKLKENPFDFINTPKIDKKIPQILTEKEMIMFLDSLSQENFLKLRNKACFELLYATGLRVSELTNLKIQDIDFTECVLRVMGKGKKERIVPFNDKARDILLKYLDEAEIKFKVKNEFIFLNSRGEKITERSVERIVQKSYKEVMKSNKRIYPHLFRHSFATHLLQRGANLRVIQELLGHENLSTTEKYTTLNYSDLLKVYKKFHPRAD
jgi:integrase/recombinase XerC